MDVKAPDEGQYRFGPYVLNPRERELFRDGVPVPLTFRLFETLLVFVRNPGRTLTKDELLEAIWPGRYMEESSLKQAIFSLRKALGGDEDKAFIVTAQGRGYSFAAPVERIVAAATPAHGGAASVPGGPASAESIAPASSPSRKTSFATLIAAVAAIALLCAGVATLYWRSRPPTVATRARVVVLADFQNLTNDPALGVVLGKVLQIDLAQSPFFVVMPQQQVAETLAQMERPRDAPLTAALAQEVCARNQGDAVFSGVVARTGSQYFVTLEAKDCSEGAAITAARASVDREEDLPTALDGLTVKAREGLHEAGESISHYEVPIAQATTSSFAALTAYSLGERRRIHGDNAGALPFYKHAIELDPKFALAYAELANCYFGLREMETAKSIYRKAFALRDRLTESERLGIAANYYSRVGNYVEAERAFRLVTETYPDGWAPWANLANLLTNMARYDEAIVAARQALRLNPRHYGPYVVLARAYKRATRFADARGVAAAAARKGFDNWDLHGILYEIAYAEGDTATMAAEVAKEKGKATEPYMLEYEALAAATSGQLKRAQELWTQAIALARSQGPDSREDVGNFYSDEIEITAVLASPEDAAKIAATATADEQAQFEDFAFASYGEYRRAQAAAEAAAKANPDSTEDNVIELPLTLAEIDLAQANPADAIKALQPIVPYELRDFWTPYLLGRAWLGTNSPDRAAAEFSKILANRGVDGNSPLYPFAYLGLARALHMEGRNVECRDAYQKLFTFWKDADADLPILVEAKAEYSQL